MTYFRVAWRASRILAVTLLTFLLVLASRVLKPLASSPALSLRNRAYGLWARDFCRSLGIETRVRGTPPSGRFLLVSNHLGYTDIPLLAAHTDATFVAKADLSGWPLLGTIMRTADTIFIDRARKRDLVRVMKQVSSRLKDGLGVVIFPEGTTGNGEKILRFKPSLLELAARHGEPVYYATITYRTGAAAPPARDIVCWWDDTPFAEHLLRLLALDGFEATLEFGDKPLWEPDRKVLADRLWNAMSNDFPPDG